MNRIVICDTGPIIHLSEADAIHVLKLAGDILIPPAVATEIQRNLSKGRLPDWIHTRSLNAQNKGQTKIWIQNYLIDPGEAEAIGLAMQEHSDWLLTDDAQARQFAESLGLQVHGSIGLLLWAVASDRIQSREQAHRILNGLKRSSLWVSQRVLQEAAKAIDQLASE